MAWSLPVTVNKKGTTVLRGIILAGLGALVLPGAALAQDDTQPDEMKLSGSLLGGYSNYSSPQLHIGTVNAAGSAHFTIDDPGFNLQANFNNTDVFSAAFRGAEWSYGGDAFWRDRSGSIGLNITSREASDGSHADFMNYGGFGQWFLFSNVTLQLKGGWLAGRYQGQYGDLGAIIYPYSFLALELSADYAKDTRFGPDLRDLALNAEFLPVRNVPVTFALGYSRAQYRHLINSGTPDDDIFSISVKFYFGGGANDTLVDYQRKGPVDWDGPPPGMIEFAY